MKQVIALMDSFVDGRFVPAGFPVAVSDDVELSDNFKEIDGTEERAVVAASAIAPTGPNPTAPQQIAPDTIQTVEGYVKPGAVIVGEVTAPVEQRIEIVGLDETESTAEAEVVEQFQEGQAERRSTLDQTTADTNQANQQNDDDELVAGTVKELEGTIASIDDPAELDRLQAAEQDRERPRTGVMSAIDKRRAELQG